MSFNCNEFLIIGKLISNNCNDKVLTKEELKVLVEAFKREIDLATVYTEQEKETFKNLIDVAEEASKRRQDNG